MQLVKKHSVPLLNNSVLIAEREFSIATARIYANDVFHVYFFSGAYLDMDFVQAVYDFNAEMGGKAYFNLFEFEPHVDLASEVRDWAANPQGNKNTYADALVINSLPHKLLANFYMRFNKPVKPTKIFNQREKALKWLLSQNHI